MSCNVEDHDFCDDDVFDQLCESLANNDDWGEGVHRNPHVKSRSNIKQQSKVVSAEKSDGKPKRNRHRILITKNDKRKHYAERFAQLINTTDFNGLWQTIQELTTEDFVHTETFVQYVPVYDMYSEYRGQKQYYNYICACMAGIPDLVVTITYSKLYLRSDGTSYLLYRELVDGTHTHQILMTNYTSQPQNFFSKFNPFKYMFNFVFSGSSDGQQVVESSQDSSEMDAASNFLKPSQSTDSFRPSAVAESGSVDVDDTNAIATKSDRESGKTDSTRSDTISPPHLTSSYKSRKGVVTTVEVPLQQVKVATQKSGTVIGKKKDIAVRISFESTKILFINKQNKAYRCEAFKRPLPNMGEQVVIKEDEEDDEGT